MPAQVTVTDPMPIADLARTDARIAFMTGTGEFLLTGEQKKVIKDFVSGGGTLVIDAAGGPRFRMDSKAGTEKMCGFAASAERSLEDIFGRGSLRPLPPGSPIYAQHGQRIDKVKYRRRTRKRLGGHRLPALQAVMVDGRAAVIYSREDITAGLVGYDCATVDGYRPEFAFQLLRNIVLFADSTSAARDAGGGSFSPPGKSIARPEVPIEL